MQENLKGEILSPVGSWEMLISAVRSGADAVYLGFKDFSARRNAENFDFTQLKDAIEYCHIRNVKVYLTLNILIKDNEFANAVNLAQNAYNLGIDGIIVQDLGLAQVLHNLLPELPLHASTQMSVHSVSALPILKKLGFCQVVVAREMSLEDLTEFCKVAKQFDITVEVFVHGALCMAVSGQCLLSAFLGSRSGNRGLCAGPCRLPFTAENGTGYDLSLKDLSLLEYIPKLYEIGVRSFKIEGRMKRPEYVAAATSACKTALQKGAVNKELSETLKNVFSRSGFTSGYLENKLGKDMFGIRTKEDVESAKLAFPKLHEIYRNERQSVKVSVKVKIKREEPITLTLEDGKNTVTVTGGIPQTAKNKATTNDDVIKNVTKFGGTPYINSSCEVLLDDGFFVPASELNALRRDATKQLSKLRADKKPSPVKVEYAPKKVISKSSNTPKIYIRIEKKEQIPQDLNNVSAVIIPLESDVEFISGVQNIVEIPRGIISEKLLEEKLFEFKEKGFKMALCGNIAAVEIAQKQGYEVLADTGLNVHNTESAKTCENLGVRAVVLSNELTLEDSATLNSPISKGIMSYGNIPLMLFKNCPLKNGRSCAECNKKGALTDRKGIEFPVRCRMGYSEMLNSVPIWLADKQTLLKGFDFQILYFVNEPRERVSEVISAYKNGKEADCKYTRGLLFRGTI